MKTQFDLRSRGWYVLAIFLTLMLWGTKAYGQQMIPAVDGNPQEWQAVLSNPLNLIRGFVPDPNKTLPTVDNIFKQGSKVDGLISSWTWGELSPPPKGDLVNVGYTITKEPNPDFNLSDSNPNNDNPFINKLFVFFDRLENNGSVTVGFWLFKNGDVYPKSDFKFNGIHVTGDLYVVIDFANGGANPIIKAWVWNGTTNQLDPISTANLNQGTDWQIISNPSPYPVPSVLQPNYGSATYDQYTFFEGFLNLNSVTANTGASDVCFATAMVTTVSSTSTSAEMKDFLMAQISTKPIVSADTVTACAGTPAFITAAVTGGSGIPFEDPVTHELYFEFQWDGGNWVRGTSINLATNPITPSMSFNPLPGTHSVMARGSNGCSSDAAIGLLTFNPLPNAPTANNVAVCYDGLPHTGSATAGAGESIVWYAAATGATTAAAPSRTEVGTTTTYAAARNNTTQCEGPRTPVTVTIYALPAAPTATNVAVCFDGAAHTGSATAGANESIVWYAAATGSTPAAAPSRTAVGTTTTYAAAVSANQCEGPRTPVTVTIYPLPVLVIHNPAAVCYPFTVDLTDASVTSGSTLNGATLTYFYENGTTPLLHPEAVSESGIYQIKATTSNGCMDMKPVTVTIENCLSSYCSLTQGFYGNQKGKFCDGTNGYDLVMSLLSSAKGGDIVIGSGVRSFTINEGNAACVRSILPGGGTPAIIPLGGPWGCGNLGTIPGVLLTKQGRLNNILLAQTITLALNLRLDPNLANVVLNTQSFYTRGASGCELALPNYPLGDAVQYTIPNEVWNYFQPGTPKIKDIFTLASMALGGANTGVSLSAINKAVSMFNEAADECQYMFFPSALKSATATSDAPSIIATESGNITVQVVPNPFKAFTEVQIMSPVDSKTAKVEIYDVAGRLITSYVSDGLEAGVTKSFMILDSDLAANQSIFICVVRTDQGTVTKRIMRL